ncbi:MAG TPA: hypothetical protein VM840_01050 [Actinomycetota bacterium]|nr:hypothetical protein [Actinomycetota bacterium]
MTSPVLLAVPNLSEGRDPALVRELADHPALLDVHIDPDHNRSVLTYGGPPDVVGDACLSLVSRAVARLDLRAHEGVHPRNGVVDVLPIVPFRAEVADAERLAGHLAREITTQHGVTVHRYGADDLPALRRGLRGTSGHPTAGVVSVGVRGPLIAFNVNARGTLEGAREVASEVRRIPAVRALGFELPSRGLVQVSMNLTDPSITGPREAYGAVTARAATHGLSPVEAEVVGLVPEVFLVEIEGLPMAGPVRSVEAALRG